MEDHDAPDIYGDSEVTSGHAGIGWWLKVLYIALPIWGVIWFCLYWNGVHGWLDRGYWSELEKAANTTFPNTNSMETKNDSNLE